MSLPEFAVLQITFKVDHEQQICDSYDDEKDEGEFSNEVFKIGEVIEVDLLTEHDVFINVQFANGSVAMGIPKSVIDIEVIR